VTPVESVTAALADERRNPNVRVGVDTDPASGAVRVQLFTTVPLHTSVFLLSGPELKNPEGRYLVELGKHERALANLSGRGAR
jgi:hypothetical protein